MIKIENLTERELSLSMEVSEFIVGSGKKADAAFDIDM